LAEKFVDFIAIGRVASRAELKSIRVTDVSASCDPHVAGTLEPTLDLECKVLKRDASLVEIGCDYRFSATAGDAKVAKANVKYLLTYEISGVEPVADGDLNEFAIANGTLHSWPFVRETLYGLTSRMGFPPYTLPVHHFKPKPVEKKATPAKKPTAEATPPAKPSEQ
jgi:hypothetical protein